MGMQLHSPPWLLSEEQIVSKLLGLTMAEYLDLSHSRLREVRDFKNDILYYYIVVSPLNAETTLLKLKKNKSGIIYLPADYRARKRQSEACS